MWSEHVQRACEAWPSLRFDVAHYRAWFVESCGGETELAARLASVDPGETLLCWCAGCGAPEALRLFDIHYMQQVAPALRRFGDAELADEVAQRVRVKLLVAAPGQLAPIVRYAFGGGLGGLVRVAAIREALTMRRLAKPAAGEELEDLVGETDPELRALKARYGREFQAAFAAAVGLLSPRDRHLLRLNLSARASIDEIARMHHTHRATAARWLNAARDRLAAAIRGHLQATLGASEGELESLLRMIRTEAPRLLESIPAE
jgi:RNA polymerase sigma-70 factor (ECF subfamily)